MRSFGNMLTLAIEQSTLSCSIALLRKGELLGERAWQAGRFRGQQLFPVLRELLEATATGAGDIDFYAVGLGPGVFSGLRIALAAARAMALPGAGIVRGVSSGEALALELFQSGTPPPLTVVGDARRERLWVATFDWDGTRPQPRGEYTLVALASLPEAIPAGATLATPDWGRIGEALASMQLGDCQLVEHEAIPRATLVARLAASDERDERPAPPLEPIYIHPPVFVEPKFPAR